MLRLHRVSGASARGAIFVAAATAAALSVAHAQSLRDKIGGAKPPAAVAAPAPPAAPPAPQAMSESVAATVNDAIISTYDLAQRMRLLIVTSGVQPTQDTLPQFQREALISLIDERLQMQELRRVEKSQKIQLIATDDEVDEELAAIARQNNLSAQSFINELKNQGVGPETLKEQLRAQVSWQRWIRGRYGTRLRVGEDQIKAVQARLAAAASKPQYEISEIFIDAARVGGMENATQGASQLITQMQQGAPFPAVARQFSASATAAAGGDAGWVSPGEMAPEVDAALEQLRPGQLSQPIPVKDGVYILYLRDKRSGAGDTMVNLKQVAAALPADASAGQVEEARVKLQALRDRIKSCADIDAVAAQTSGVVTGDLGEAAVSDLAPQFREAVQGLEVNQVSEPVRTNVGLHLLALCGKRVSGGAEVDRDQVENRLFAQQLSMVSRRYMRDLRNSATIESR